MKNSFLSASLLLLSAAVLRGQAISINTDGSNADPSAILDVKSTEKGMLVPRMTSAQRNAIAAPGAGLLVYDTDSGSFWLYNGVAWTNLAAPNRLADADQDTRVQVEKSPDEDAIRFDVGGTEALVLDSARNVGIGVPSPAEKLDIAGAIKIGNTATPTPAAGTIRWNETTADFEGYTGSQWKSLTKGPGTGGGWGTTVSYEQTQASAEQETDALFGYSVGISGDYAVAGASGKDVNGVSNQGRAYVYARSSSSPWTLQAILTASDGTANDNFGLSVAISGNTIVVGAPGKEGQGQGGNKDRQGKCYVFVRSGTTWTQQAMLTASDGASNDELGYSVAIDGDNIIAGAHLRTENGNINQGKAYVFVRSGTTWTQQAMLSASDAAAGDFFGFSVAIAGNYAIVGAVAKSGTAGLQQGKAYIFFRSGANWAQQAALTASDRTANDRFGSAVAISDNYAVVGASGKELSGGVDIGGAYIYARSGTTWPQQAILEASDSESEQYFGSAVSISGDYVCIGTENFFSNRNRAYVFEHSGITWSQIATLAPSDGIAGDKFGRGVGISGNQVIVGAIFKDSGANNSGAVYFFSR